MQLIQALRNEINATGFRAQEARCILAELKAIGCRRPDAEDSMAMADFQERLEKVWDSEERKPRDTAGSRGVGHPDSYVNVVQRTDRGDGDKWRAQVRYTMDGKYASVFDHTGYDTQEQALHHGKLVRDAAVQLAADQGRAIHHLTKPEAESLKAALTSETAFKDGREGKVEGDGGIAPATLPPDSAYPVHAAPTLTVREKKAAAAAAKAEKEAARIRGPAGAVECIRCEHEVVPTFDWQSGEPYCPNCGGMM